MVRVVQICNSLHTIGLKVRHVHREVRFSELWYDKIRMAESIPSCMGGHAHKVACKVEHIESIHGSDRPDGTECRLMTSNFNVIHDANAPYTDMCVHT